MIDDDTDEGVLLEERTTALCKQYSLRLAKLALALGAAADEAVAAADDAVMHLATREFCGQLVPLDSEEAWLKKVVRNKVADILVRRGPASVADVQDLADCIAQVAYSPPERRLDAMEVLRALQSMPDHHKVPVLLAAQGWSAREIGDLLDIAEDAASKRVSRGREKLRGLTGHEQPKRSQDRIEEGRTE